MNHTADGQQTEIEAWKRKYFTALEQHEAEERQWAEADDLLRRALSRLTLAAEGQDPALDRRLHDLRDAIRDHADLRALRGRIEAVSNALVLLDDKRPGARAWRPADVLAALLDRLEPPRGSARRVKALRRSLGAVAEARVETAIDEVAALVQELAHPPVAAAAAPARSAGLLDRLFGRTPAHTRGQDAKLGDDRRTGTPAQSDGREPLLHLLDLIQRHAQAPSLTELQARIRQASTRDELRQAVEALAPVFAEGRTPSHDSSGPGELLLQLLERVDFPPELAARAGTVRDRLEDRAGLDVAAALRDVAELIAEMRAHLQREKQEIESFLKQLTGRLQDIDSCVCGAEAVRERSYQSGRDLGESVQRQVRGIEDSVRAAESLDQLKCAVQDSVEAILERVDLHRRGEQQRHQEAAEQLALLTERLRAMEAESAGLQARVLREHHLALTDTLTGIPNRLAYEERIGQEFARWKRFSTPLALAIWDVDRFKQINDRYGHKAGDKVLQVIAELLSGNIRETDFLARHGGEEFVLIMTGTARPAIQDVADKLREAVARCGFHYRGEAVPVTLSCGIAEFRPGDSIEAVFERADGALYSAKNEGRNRCMHADG